MRRIQLIELHEQPWFPQSLRNDVTDMLQHGMTLSKAYASIAPVLRCVLEAAGNPPIIDLCSGGGGPWLDLGRRLECGSTDFHVTLTDKHPNPRAFANAQARCEIPIRFYPGSVDAREVPVELDGFRTMFTAFHHFPFDEARAILQDAVNAGQGIGIFEITRRAPSAIVMTILWSFTPFLFTFFVRPFRWTRVFFTYVIPVIPLVLLFDGVVSCLRTYRPAELQKMIGKLSAPGYEWKVGEFRGGPFNLPVTCLIGYSPARSGAERSRRTSAMAVADQEGQRLPEQS